MRKLEFYASMLLMLFSLIFCHEAYKLSLGTGGRPGPGFVPFALGVALFVVSVIYFFRTLRSKQREEEIPPWQDLRWGKVILVFTLLFAYALLLEWVGFIICTLLFSMGVFSWVDKQKWYWIYIGSPVITVLFYGVFKLLLKIQLPAGVLRI